MPKYVFRIWVAIFEANIGKNDKDINELVVNLFIFLSNTGLNMHLAPYALSA
ncbi:hypothetical protein DFR42_106165 [Undibacterium pigrum]|uniref:Uncharacterized protein n=1 Tax=Undibacterium pigrum TaxID=401470 RepID=A0A318J2X6_9BURK|nr:hypothetical protein DFR42_106165 [Undibacterium pigrum]